MTRYYFDLHGADETVQDQEGIKCADAWAISAMAARILTQIAAEEVRIDERTKLFVSVRDEAGRIVHVSTLTLSSRCLSVPIAMATTDCASVAA